MKVASVAHQTQTGHVWYLTGKGLGLIILSERNGIMPTTDTSLDMEKALSNARVSIIIADIQRALTPKGRRENFYVPLSPHFVGTPRTSDMIQILLETKPRTFSQGPVHKLSLWALEHGTKNPIIWDVGQVANYLHRQWPDQSTNDSHSRAAMKEL